MPPRLISDTMLELFKMQRSPGHHVSSGIHAIMNRLYPDRFTGEPPDMTRMNLGNAMEQALVDAFARTYPENFVRPGELWDDGYLGTPDLWYLGGIPELGDEHAVVEIKLTWASSRRADDIEDAWFWRYWQQARTYCRMSKMQRALLIIVFIVGNWRDDSSPKGMMWEDHWSREELEETWEMVKLYCKPEAGKRDRQTGARNRGLPDHPGSTPSGIKSSAGTRSTTSGGRKRGRSGR